MHCSTNPRQLLPFRARPRLVSLLFEIPPSRNVLRDISPLWNSRPIRHQRADLLLLLTLYMDVLCRCKGGRTPGMLRAQESAKEHRDVEGDKHGYCVVSGLFEYQRRLRAAY